MEVFYRHLRSTHLLLLALILSGAGWVLSARSMQTVYEDDWMNISTVAIQAILVIGSIAGATLSSKYFLKRVKHIDRVSKKLDLYFGACVIKYLILMVPCIFGPLIFYITGNILLIMMASITVLIYFLNRPTIDKIIAEAGLTERQMIALKRKFGT